MELKQIRLLALSTFSLSSILILSSSGYGSGQEQTFFQISRVVDCSQPRDVYDSYSYQAGAGGSVTPGQGGSANISGNVTHTGYIGTVTEPKEETKCDWAFTTNYCTPKPCERTGEPNKWEYNPKK